MADQYRIEWRHRVTNETGQGPWFNSAQGLYDEVKRLNSEMPEVRHWVHDSGAQARHEKRMEERQNGEWPE